MAETPTITNADGSPLSHAERVVLYMTLLHMSEAAARELIAFEDGVTHGDVIVLDEDGDEVRSDED